MSIRGAYALISEGQFFFTGTYDTGAFDCDLHPFPAVFPVKKFAFFRNSSSSKLKTDFARSYKVRSVSCVNRRVAPGTTGSIEAYDIPAEKIPSSSGFQNRRIHC